jgi:hypothetical protein
MFQQAFKNIDDALWKESGCTTELIAINEAFLLMLTNCTKVSYQEQRQTRVRLAMNPEKHSCISGLIETK